MLEPKEKLLVKKAGALSDDQRQMIYDEITPLITRPLLVKALADSNISSHQIYKYVESMAAQGAVVKRDTLKDGRTKLISKTNELETNGIYPYVHTPAHPRPRKLHYEGVRPCRDGGEYTDNIKRVQCRICLSKITVVPDVKPYDGATKPKVVVV